jgi:hypothetical protein
MLLANVALKSTYVGDLHAIIQFKQINSEGILNIVKTIMMLNT